LSYADGQVLEMAVKVPELVEGPTVNDGVSTLRVASGTTGSTTSYTFTAKTTDYESRFKLVFSTNDADDTSTPSTGSETEGSEPDDVRTQKMVIE
jgi:hypothetical protein